MALSTSSRFMINWTAKLTPGKEHTTRDYKFQVYRGISSQRWTKLAIRKHSRSPSPRWFLRFSRDAQNTNLNAICVRQDVCNKRIQILKSTLIINEALEALAAAEQLPSEFLLFCFLASIRSRGKKGIEAANGRARSEARKSSTRTLKRCSTRCEQKQRKRPSARLLFCTLKANPSRRFRAVISASAQTALSDSSNKLERAAMKKCRIFVMNGELVMSKLSTSATRAIKTTQIASTEFRFVRSAISAPLEAFATGKLWWFASLEWCNFASIKSFTLEIWLNLILLRDVLVKVWRSSIESFVGLLPSKAPQRKICFLEKLLAWSFARLKLFDWLFKLLSWKSTPQRSSHFTSLRDPQPATPKSYQGKQNKTKKSSAEAFQRRFNTPIDFIM